MVGSAASDQPLRKYLVPVPVKSLARRPDLHLHPGRALHSRRLRKPTFPRSGAGRKAELSRTSGRRGGPGTPLLRWKFEDAGHLGKLPGEACGSTSREAVNVRGRAVEAVSARKLAAGIWNLQLREVIRSGGVSREATQGFEHDHGDLRPAHTDNDNSINVHYGLKNGFSSSIPIHKFASPILPNHEMERATKWDAGCPRNSEEVLGVYSQLKLLEGQHVSTSSIISSLRSELERARAQIYGLKAERQSAKAKLDSLLRKVAEEKASWRSREHEKVRAIIDILKDDLSREKRNRQWSEIVNFKLRDELAEVKLSAKQLSQDYEKERKARELMEEVCDELANEIEEDKAEVEALKRNNVKIQEEVEEERKMLQIAEVWREERVQMKLLDAKLALEDKYSELNKLQAELIAFLRDRTGRSSDKAEIRQAELLKEAVDLVKVEEMEFSYQPPPASEDIFSVFEELQRKGETNGREIEACYAYSPASHYSNFHSLSPATDAFLEKPTRGHCNRDTDDDSDWETLSPGEEQELRNSGEGVEPSVTAVCEESNASVSGKDNAKQNNEGFEVYSLAARQLGKKGDSLTRLWRSSHPNNGEIRDEIAVELSNGKASDAAQSPSSPIGRWASPDLVNSHKARGMKGCIEWPRGSQNKSLKTKLLEARMERQKIQLCDVLRQKV